ncbi:FtsX-like permease family protein [Streptomonospora sp. PA3]|uniref:FtsX-like permease family protein n=1 Tax=Streptomonospora sp. PA3 TaxID=2607326 RepID=UPI0012DF23E1|nr:FtsX-like permease family protein [Streptomonospora sp. PA3]MUL41709.1 FtsX-like permease family protein [Streptomonospora sp. PA3]
MSGPGAPERRAAPLRWCREVALGAGMSVSGGRVAWVRIALMATAVGAAVALLLGAASAPTLMDARTQRDEARSYDLVQPEPRPSAHTLLIGYADTDYRDRRVFGRVLVPEGPRAPLPPGVDELPAPGEMLVSPALERLLGEPGHRLLRERLDYRVAGTIGDEGLLGPHELAFYAVEQDGALDPRMTSVTRIDDFGKQRAESGTDPAALLLVLVGAVVALLPLGVFVAAALRFGADQRDRRLAALRLLGADRWTAGRIACGETLVGALAGLAAGVGLFLPLREAVPPLRPGGIDVFTADVVPHPVLAGIVSVGVVALAVGVTVVSTARAAADPLGVTRRASRPRRRLWWRAAVAAAGAALLLPMVTGPGGFESESASLLAVAGVALLLLGAGALTPWLFQVAVSRARRGGAAWLLAVRRLRADGAAETRVVSGVVVAVAGVIALQSLFTGVAERSAELNLLGQGTPQFGARIPGTDPAEVEATDERLRSLPQTRDVRTVVEYPRVQAPSGTLPMRVGGCDALRRYADIGACSDGDAFVVETSAPDARPARGDRLRIPGAGETASWTLPASTRPVPLSDAAEGDPQRSAASVLATPGAIAAAGLPGSPAKAFFDIAPATPRAVEEVRTAVREINPLADTVTNGAPGAQRVLDALRALLTAAVTASLAVIGLGLLISTVEQLRESRQALAVLAATGVRRRTLALSVLYQSAIPLAVGLSVAAATGTLLGRLLMRMLGLHADFDASAIAATVGAAAAVVLAVTVLSLPALVRLMRPDNLREE